MEAYWIYPIYTTALAIIFKAVIPREYIKKSLIYGLIFGGLADSSLILIVSLLLKVGGYINYGPFGFKGVAFFPPIAWTIWFIMYFYFLPAERYLRYIYIFIAAGSAVFFSNVLVNLKIFEWNYGRIIIPFIIYFSWFTTSAWLKEKIDNGK